MKKLIVILACILFMTSAVQSQQDVSQFFYKTNAFLKTYVHNHLVSYGEIKKDPKQIIELVKLVENFDVSKLSDANSEKAFWINAYNLLVINSVVRNSPIESPKDVAGFFDTRKHRAAGGQLTLNDIENIKPNVNIRYCANQEAGDICKKSGPHV